MKVKKPKWIKTNQSEEFAFKDKKFKVTESDSGFTAILYSGNVNVSENEFGSADLAKASLELLYSKMVMSEFNTLSNLIDWRNKK